MNPCMQVIVFYYNVWNYNTSEKIKEDGNHIATVPTMAGITIDQTYIWWSIGTLLWMSTWSMELWNSDHYANIDLFSYHY